MCQFYIFKQRGSKHSISFVVPDTSKLSIRGKTMRKDLFFICCCFCNVYIGLADILH